MSANTKLRKLAAIVFTVIVSCSALELLERQRIAPHPAP